MRASMKTVLLAFVLLSAAGLCGATDMYKWKDESGRTHVAESVPERYKRVATKIDSRQFEVQESEKAAALARGAKEREHAASMAADRARAADAASAPPLGLSASQPRAGTSRRQGESSCDQHWRLYFESQACFAPYQRREVGPRVEAYSNCQTVQAPPSECGPAKVVTGN